MTIQLNLQDGRIVQLPEDTEINSVSDDTWLLLFRHGRDIGRYRRAEVGRIVATEEVQQNGS